MSRMQQVKRGWSQLIDHLRSLRTRARSNDDSVESQAETLRIWMWASAAGLALIVVATMVSRSSDSNDDHASRPADIAMADQLPSGFVLVPIEPTNLDSLDSIFGQHGYADLYRADGSRQKGQRLVRGVALVRSPKNPRRFAVLIPESESTRMSELAEPVLVILRKGPAPKENESLKLASTKRTHAPRKIDLIEEAEPDVISLNDSGENL